MARPTKKGADYVPVDIQMDDDVRLIEAEFGLTGFAMLVKLWQKIYGLNGYYCAFGRDEKLLFAKDNTIPMELLEGILAACLARGIFHMGLYTEYGILTSAGLQRRFFTIIAEKRRSIPAERRYMLIPAPVNVEFSDTPEVPATITPIYSDETPINSEFSATSKGSKGSKGSKEAEVTRAREDASADTGGAATAGADIADFLDPERAAEDAAAEELRNPKLARLVQAFTENIHPPTPMEGEDLREWTEEFDEDLVMYAFREATKGEPGCRSARYVAKILQNIRAAGVTNAAGLPQYAERHQARARGHPSQAGKRPVKEVAQHRYAAQRDYTQSELDALVCDPFAEEEQHGQENDNGPSESA